MKEQQPPTIAPSFAAVSTKRASDLQGNMLLWNVPAVLAIEPQYTKHDSFVLVLYRGSVVIDSYIAASGNQLASADQAALAAAMFKASPIQPEIVYVNTTTSLGRWIAEDLERKFGIKVARSAAR